MKQPAPATPADFLSRIANKARGAENPIAPRLRSLFEPTAATPTPAAADAAELASPGAVREAQDARPAPLAQPGRRAHELRSSILRPIEFAQQDNEPVQGEMGLAALEPDAAPPTGLRPAPVSTADPRESGLDSRPDRQAHASVREVDKRFAQQPALLPSARVVARDGETEARRLEEAKRKLTQASLKQLQGQPGALLPEPAALRKPRAAAPETSRTQPSTMRDVQPAQALQELPAPVINVTIGRVEVRAVQSANSRPRTDPARSKALSLDDYLKQRNRR